MEFSQVVPVILSVICVLVFALLTKSALGIESACCNVRNQSDHCGLLCGGNHTGALKPMIYHIRPRNLEGQNFRSVDLRGQSFQNQDLRCADFTDANLAGVNFQNASLWLARFTGACLIDADLRGADLQSVDLSQAVISGVLIDPCTHLLGTQVTEQQMMFLQLRGVITGLQAWLLTVVPDSVDLTS